MRQAAVEQENSDLRVRSLDAAVETLLATLRPKFECILWHHRIPSQDCEDLVQEILTSLVRRYGSVQNPQAWLISALRYQCRQYWRRRRRCLYRLVDQALLEGLAIPQSSQAERYDQAHDLERILPQIRPRCRRVLKLRYELGLTPKEVARELGYRHSGISTIISRCLAALTSRLLAAGYSETRSHA